MTLECKTKPFPWRCPKCLGREVHPATIEYTSRVKHDGRSHELTLRELVVPKCPACGELVFCNETEEQISRALRDKLGLLQPDEIRRKREKLGLTQKALGKRIGVAPETISRWESGLLIQSRAMDTLLRIFFDFPDVRAALGTAWASPGFAGSLTDLVSVTQPGPLTWAGIFLGPVACSPAVLGLQAPVAAMLEASVSSQWQSVGEVGCPATGANDIPADTCERMAA